MLRVVEFIGLESNNPEFRVQSSHREELSLRFEQFLTADVIIDFNDPDTEWLQVMVLDNGRDVGYFNINFEEFQDYKRKECMVTFQGPSGRTDNAVIELSYEGQLIDNELQYERELREMNMEDREEAKDFKNDFLEIKRKLASLFPNRSMNERIGEREPLITLNNADHLNLQEKLLLSRVGPKHHSLKSSYVDFIKRAQMKLIEVEKKNYSDRHPVHPLVVDSKSSFIRIKIYAYI